MARMSFATGLVIALGIHRDILMPPARILPKDIAAPTFRRQEFPLRRVGRILKTRRRRLARSAGGLDV